MKKIILSVALALPLLSFAQEGASKENPETCTVPAGFKEPKGQAGQKMLKKVGATVDDLKLHVSVDRGVDIKDITLMQISEQLGNGIYNLCIKGTKYKYRRSGSVFYRDADEHVLRDFNMGK